MVTSRIVATGAGIPSQVITNDDLAQIMDTSDEWIRQRTGIGERHISGGEDLFVLHDESRQTDYRESRDRTGGY